jgi:cyclic-di-GMP phosphodiesterase, flagellum assembly factor TipF
MRRLTLALLTATYLCLALIVALGLWRTGAGWGVALSCASGALGLCLASHGIIARILEMRDLRAEVEAVREAHQIMLDQVTRLDGRMVEVGRVVEADHGRAVELTDEIQLLEQLVQNMSRRIDEAPRHAADEAAPRRASGLAETVRDALAENRVDLYLQPVLSLPQRKTVYYESFSRLRDATGQVIMPGEYLAVAEPAGLVAAIDNLLLFRCVQIVRRLARQDRRVGIFCNISMASLGDEAFFPQFLDMLRANRDLAPALVFEVGQAAFDTRTAAQARNMGKLADLGFRFSLDKVLNLDLDLQELQRADVRFLKIAARTLLDELVEVGERLVLRSMPDLAAEDFALLARRYGLEVVAEKVETERQVVDILDLDIRLGQGHLFGEPRAIREAVLAESGPPPASVERLRAQAA